MQNKIRCAFILSAGYGNRLRPLTDILPKPLVPIRGKTPLELVFDKLIAAGVSKFIVNIHHLRHEFDAKLASLRRSDGRFFYNGAEIFLSYEDKILDTGGGIKHARKLLMDEEAILVHNADILFSAPARRFIGRAAKAIFDEGKAAVLCLRDSGSNMNVGVRRQCVCDMRHKLGNPAERNLQFTGFFAAGRGFLEECFNAKEDVFSTVDVILKLIARDAQSVGFYAENSGSFSDIGTPAEYLKACGRNSDTFMGMLAKLKCLGFEPSSPALIDKGASARKFVRFTDARDGRKLVACFYPKAKREDALYARIAKFLLSNKIDVPKTALADARRRIFVMGDGGNLDLLTLVRTAPEKAERFYEMAVENALRLHTTATQRFLGHPFEISQPFDSGLYDWEHNYFKQECMRAKFSAEPDEKFEAQLRELKATLLNQPQVLLHRDFQSQNIIVGKNSISIIDFQGMRMGCAMYDLASLLYDPYADISDSLRHRLLRLYFGRAPDDGELKLFYLAASQRLLQALGAYGFLSIKKGKPEYAKFFAPALERLIVCSGNAGLKSVQETALKLRAKLPLQ